MLDDYCYATLLIILGDYLAMFRHIVIMSVSAHIVSIFLLPDKVHVIIFRMKDLSRKHENHAFMTVKKIANIKKKHRSYKKMISIT